MRISLQRSKQHWLKLFVVLFATLPFSYNCIEQPADFKAPTWETPLNLTLVTKTFYFSDMVGKDPDFDTTTGVVLYKPTKNEKGYEKGIPKDVFNMPSPKGNTIQQEIGVVPVDLGNQSPASITAAQLGINSSNLNPTFDPQLVTLSPSQLGIPLGPILVDIPGISIDRQFGDTTKFNYLIFANGTMSLKITNNFPIAIKFSGDSLRLVNFNIASDSVEVVATFKFTGQIDAGTSKTSTPAVPLAGVKMDGILKLKGTMSTVGASGQQLTTSHNLASELTIAGAQIQSMVPDPAPPVVLSQIFGDSTDFKYITFETGQMALTIKNSFPFNIQFTGDSLTMVNNKDTTDIVGTFIFSGKILANSTVTSNPVQLVGTTMDAILRLKGVVNISNYFGKTVSGTDKIVASLSLTDGKLRSALVNTINFNPTSVLAINDSGVLLDEKIKVKLAKFESGGMDIRIENQTALKLSVKFRISELKNNLPGNTKDGKVYSLPGADLDTIVTINPGNTLTDNIKMEEVSFVSRDITLSGDTSVTQKLHFGLEIKTLKATSGYALINSSDLVIADVQPSGSFVLSEVQGKIPPETLQVNQNFDVSIGDIGNNLTLKGIKSAINLSAIIDLRGKLFPSDVNLYVVPVNKSGGYADSVHITKRVQSGISTIPIDSASVNKLMNSFLATLGELPSKFLVRGNVIISPLDLYNDNSNATVGVGGITQKDSVFVNLDYSIPVAIGIKDGLLRNPPTAFEQTLPDTQQIDLIKNGKIYLDVMNTFPLDIDMKIKLLKGIAVGDSLVADTVSLPALTIPQIPSDSANYPPLHILADTTIARTGQHSFTFLNLNSGDAKKLGDASFSAIDLYMKTSGNGNTAKVFNLTDKLVMTIRADIIFLVDTDKLK